MDRWPLDLFHVVWIGTPVSCPSGLLSRSNPKQPRTVNSGSTRVRAALGFTVIQQALKRGPARKALAGIFQKASKGSMTDAEGLKLAKQAEARIVGAMHIAIQVHC